MSDLARMAGWIVPALEATTRHPSRRAPEIDAQRDELWDSYGNQYRRGPALAVSSDADLVDAADACPTCAERRIDYLVWDVDGEMVTCATCATVYVP